jgi:hypothetical protein
MLKPNKVSPLKTGIERSGHQGCALRAEQPNKVSPLKTGIERRKTG